MKLVDLVKNVNILKSSVQSNELEIFDITDYSKIIKKDMMFIAHNGKKQNGNEFITEAINKGANCIVVDDEAVYETITGVSKILVENARVAKSQIAINYYQNPLSSMKTIGIVGNFGKTSTAFMIKGVLDKVGIKSGIISSENIAIGDKIVSNKKREILDSIELQRLFRIMANEKVQIVVMEIPQVMQKDKKISNIIFDKVIYTNMTKDNYDKENFSNVSEYLNSIIEVLKNSKEVILNSDDLAFKFIENNKELNIKKYGIANKADQNAVDINIRNIGLDYITIIEKVPTRISLKMMGRENVYNSLAAILTLNSLGIKAEAIQDAIKDIQVPGNYELVVNELDLPIVVDNSNSPEKIEKVIRKAKLFTTGRVVSIIGFDSNYTNEELEKLGTTSAKYSDTTIITSLHQRTANLSEGISKIVTSARKEKNRSFVIENRKEAIEFALEKAEKRDTILIFGLGNEKFLEINEEKVLFNEKEIVKNYIEKKAKSMLKL